MNRLLLGKIDVTKIDKERLFKGAKGTYLDIVVWINDKEDQYGQIASIEQSTGKDEPKIYIGNLKEFARKEDAVEKITEKQNTGLEDDGEMPF